MKKSGLFLLAVATWCCVAGMAGCGDEGGPDVVSGACIRGKDGRCWNANNESACMAQAPSGANTFHPGVTCQQMGY